MVSFLVRCRSEFFPISSWSESIEIQEGMTVQYGVRDTNNALQTEQSFFVDFISAQQISVVAKISQEPAQPPERFGRAVDSPREGMVAMLVRFEDQESQEIEGSGWVPPIHGAFHTNQENTFELIGAVGAFVMQAGNMAFHEGTSCGLA
jgi:hypothetical protein